MRRMSTALIFIATTLLIGGNAYAVEDIDDLDVTIHVMDREDLDIDEYMNEIKLPDRVSAEAREHAEDGLLKANDVRENHGDGEHEGNRDHGIDVSDDARDLGDIMNDEGRESHHEAVSELVEKASEGADEHRDEATEAAEQLEATVEQHDSVVEEVQDNMESVQDTVTEQSNEAQEQASDVIDEVLEDD